MFKWQPTEQLYVCQGRKCVSCMCLNTFFVYCLYCVYSIALNFLHGKFCLLFAKEMHPQQSHYSIKCLFDHTTLHGRTALRDHPTLQILKHWKSLQLLYGTETHVSAALSVCPCIQTWPKQYLLNHKTFHNQTWYGSALTWVEASSQTFGMLPSGFRSQWCLVSSGEDFSRSFKLLKLFFFFFFSFQANFVCWSTSWTSVGWTVLNAMFKSGLH